MTKHKHLTLSDRNDIQLGLERGETFKAIGQSILKDPTSKRPNYCLQRSQT
ncbi:helix-turn-helix domain-containing protein, partial [Streptococcus mitis]|uniref:helix-turn-helix domain-containing protein n=1 Tax=Streptococcus mitis TaxID=28037 RepID=UPI0037D9B65D